MYVCQHSVCDHAALWQNEILIVNRVDLRRIDTDIGKQKKGSTSHTRPVVGNQKMKEKSRLESLIEKYVDPRLADGLIGLIKTSIRLKLVKKDSKTGDTKFGGTPDLSKDSDWPRNSDKIPYTFICQIKLLDVKTYDDRNELPESGILYVFFNLDSWDDGLIIYSEQTDDLEIPPIPEELKKEKKSWIQKLLGLEGKKYMLDEFGVEISQEYYLPSWDSLKIERLVRNTDRNIKRTSIFAEEIYEQSLLQNEGETELTTNHHLLGNYNGIQHEYYELELIKVRASLENLSIEQIDKALNWKLLFQLDSDRNLGLNWGDWGKIYFFIEEQDLSERRFDKVKIIGDCY